MKQDDGAKQEEAGTPALLDDTAKRIIEQLQEDGRRPYGAIGKAVGLSEAAVRQRVARLTRAGVIQIVAVTDPMQVGMFRQAMLGIKVEGPLQPVADALSEMTETSYVILCAGRFDVLCEVVCGDDEALLGVISDQVRTIEGVRYVEIMVYLRLQKQTYQWGTR